MFTLQLINEHVCFITLLHVCGRKICNKLGFFHPHILLRRIPVQYETVHESDSRKIHKPLLPNDYCCMVLRYLSLCMQGVSAPGSLQN